MKLVKKNYKSQMKTTVWVTEQHGSQTVKRKLFTCYDTTIEDIEKILMKIFKEK